MLNCERSQHSMNFPIARVDVCGRPIASQCGVVLHVLHAGIVGTVMRRRVTSLQQSRVLVTATVTKELCSGLVLAPSREITRSLTLLLMFPSAYVFQFTVAIGSVRKLKRCHRLPIEAGERRGAPRVGQVPGRLPIQRQLGGPWRFEILTIHPDNPSPYPSAP